MKYLKLAVLQLIAAIAVYLLLFLAGKALAYIGWILIIAIIAAFLYWIKLHKGLWWWEKSKRKLWRVLSCFCK